MCEGIGRHMIAALGHQDSSRGLRRWSADKSPCWGPLGLPAHRAVERGEVSWTTESRVVCYTVVVAGTEWWLPRKRAGPAGRVGLARDTGAGSEP